MRRKIAILLAWTVTFGLLAGCSGGNISAETTDEGDEAEPPRVDVTADTGGIAGLVTDDSLLPLVNATASLQVSRNTPVLVQEATGPDGRFAFSRIDPGTYVVTAAAEGYGAASTLVQVVAGEVHEVQLIPNELPSDDPYVDVFIQDGILRCGFSYVAFADTCTVSEVMGSNQIALDFNISAGHQWLVDETYWDDSSVTMDHDFFVRDQGEEPRGTIVGRGYGLPVLRTEFWPGKEYQATPVADVNVFPATDEEFTFRIETYYDGQYQQEINDAAPAACAYMLLGYCTGLGVTFEMQFTEYVSVFMNGAPKDAEKYSAVPDA